MRAVVCKALSGLDGLVVEDIPLPEPGPGEVRIRVRAAGLNFADTLMIKGQYQDQPALPFVPGHGDRRPDRALRRGRGRLHAGRAGAWRRPVTAASPRRS